LGRVRASQGDEASLGVAIQLPFPAGPVLPLAYQGGVQALLDEPFPDPLDRADVDLDRLGNAGVRPSRAVGGGIGLEQDTGVGQFQGRSLVGGDQVLQGVTFIRGERDLVLFHGGFLPFPP
jgi:hypothetical protein